MQYHKIHTIFKRDPETNHRTLLMDEYSTPEFEYLKDVDWMYTEKVDGTNIRVTWDGQQVHFGGKTDNAQIPARLIKVLLDMFSAYALGNLFPDTDYKPPTEGVVEYPPVTLYGEGYGAKIQKGGGLYRDDQSFVLFDVKVGPWWLRRDDVMMVADNLGIEYVPILGGGTLATMVEMVREGFNSFWGPFKAEGIVARPEVELFDRAGRRIITKLKYKDFRHAD